jgi:Holliday junction DNA helicase RuvA
MIGRLTGVVVEESATGGVLLDVNGVGYQLSTPVGTVARAPTTERQHTVLYVHTHVREDALDLFGFASTVDREVFRRLLNVPNVGPKTALGVLSAIPSDDLAVAIRNNNVRRLGQVPGIGKKTAERLVLELREKLDSLLELGAPPQRSTPEDTRALVCSALTGMGYKQAEADRAVKSLGDRVDTEPVNALLRAALRELTP